MYVHYILSPCILCIKLIISCNNKLPKFLRILLLLYIYIDNDDTHLDKICTYINLTALRRECGDLDKLLISSKDIEFKEVLGEGILMYMHV